jgi:hypothetical protein
MDGVVAFRYVLDLGIMENNVLTLEHYSIIRSSTGMFVRIFLVAHMFDLVQMVKGRTNITYDTAIFIVGFGEYNRIDKLLQTLPHYTTVRK